MNLLLGLTKVLKKQNPGLKPSLFRPQFRGLKAPAPSESPSGDEWALRAQGRALGEEVRFAGFELEIVDD